MSLRQDVIKAMNGDVSYESIYKACKSKGYTNAKAEEVTKTILTYLDYSMYETASLMNCNLRTISRRIHDFLNT